MQAASAVRAGLPCVIIGALSDPATWPLLDGDTLCESERQRAAAFRVAQARDEFVAARGLVRALLGAVLATVPTAINLHAPTNHKPRLITAGRTVDFSLTHSGGWIGCALLGTGQIGLDLEESPTGREAEASRLAHMVCTKEERTWIQSVSDTERSQIFLDLWRRKEALLKAAGLGFSGEPTSVAVLSPDGQPLSRIAFAGRDWQLAALQSDGLPEAVVAWSEDDSPH
ncbi:4'-phosphopantetheinyl transferase family protein [Antarctobacter jejuensis]|uniref:4'-phosphopantetheinyl transferase family protein n=1 Tax=Antarctobacter jejuensis TaxID=1439938 RepID=UPI003FD1D980